MGTKLSILFAALVFGYLIYSFVNAGDALSATTITPWDTAKADYPSSTDGTAGAAAGGIVWSRHNLSSYGMIWQSGNNYSQAPTQQMCTQYDENGDCLNWQTITTGPAVVQWQVATTEICVFCHTPHFGRTDTAPLWNRGSSATGYIAYGTTVGGTVISSVGGSSLACLSCHDGITTFDNLINQPGKGSRTDGTGAEQNYTFTMWGQAFGTNLTTVPHYFKSSTTDVSDGPVCAMCHPQSESNRLNIGLSPSNQNPKASGIADLSNDHPINVAYNGGTMASLRATSTVISSITINQARGFGGASIYGRSDNLWAVKGFISNTATIGDLLRDNGKVQCTSCHDPHYKNQTNNDPSLIDSYDRTGAPGGGEPYYNYDVTSQYDKLIDGLFLRRVGGNSNSGVCRTCHNK